MKKFLIMVLSTIVITTALVGCSGEKNMDERVDTPTATEVKDLEDNEKDNASENTSEKVMMSDEIKQSAEEDGIESDEYLKMINSIIQEEAKARAISVEEYLKEIEDAGKTPLQEIKEIIEPIKGMTVKQYYEMNNSAEVGVE